MKANVTLLYSCIPTFHPLIFAMLIVVVITRLCTLIVSYTRNAFYSNFFLIHTAITAVYFVSVACSAIFKFHVNAPLRSRMPALP